MSTLVMNQQMLSAPYFKPYSGQFEHVTHSYASQHALGNQTQGYYLSQAYPAAGNAKNTNSAYYQKCVGGNNG